MAVNWLLICHGLVTLIVIISFLCGQWPIFQGTPIERLHHFITFGAYDYFLRFVGFVFGDKARRLVLSIERCCCDRPNPFLQVIYLAIIGATYYYIVKSSFRYIPGYYLGEVHKYTSLLAVGIGIVLFLLTSFSDPGTVKAGNVSEYLLAYPYDNIIYTEKECSTCKIPKLNLKNGNFALDVDQLGPSTAAYVIDVLLGLTIIVVGWFNNCIGEKNTRYFLAFLLCCYVIHVHKQNVLIFESGLDFDLAFSIGGKEYSSRHCLLCVYGAVALALIIAGRFKELRIAYILTVYYGVENSFRSLTPHVAQVLSRIPYFVCCYTFVAFVNRFLVFTVAAELIQHSISSDGVSCHSFSIVGWIFWVPCQPLSLEHDNKRGLVRLHTFKWEDYISWQKKLNEARASAAALKASISGMSSEAKRPESKFKSFFRRSPLEDTQVVAKENKYDKGFFRNVFEVIFPLSTRSSFLHTKSKPS
ncbi:hypothetical protein DKX38_007212 [Salix brachista]|uniref:Protein S-acyltransferase n=1 Tax=Salix brachista TaxID=2182728 RepID=A0A5N5MPH6_9ROSI|nr:hypothetical protein DKX38_007212 [Salix brachista]